MSRGNYVDLMSTGAPGWVPLPLDSDEPAEAWSRDAIREAAGSEVADDHPAVQMLAGMVSEMRAKHAPEIFCHLAWVLHPEPLEPIYAVAEAAVYPFEPGMSTPQEFVELYSGESDPLQRGEVEQTETAIGHTVVVRRFVADEPTTDEGIPGDVWEGCAYVMFPPGLEGFVYLNAQWPHISLGDSIATAVGALAHSLEIDFVQEGS